MKYLEEDLMIDGELCTDDKIFRLNFTNQVTITVKGFG